MVPKDRNDPNTYKVRRAKVGGYRDYFDDGQVAQIAVLMESTLSPYFGYTTQDADTGMETTATETQTTGSQ